MPDAIEREGEAAIRHSMTGERVECLTDARWRGAYRAYEQCIAIRRSPERVILTRCH